MITRFSPPPASTHGHHTASAVLAVEAFKLAGDPKAFPGAARRSEAVAAEAHPAERRRSRLAARSTSAATTRCSASRSPRSPAAAGMHKSQGFGNFGGRWRRRAAAGVVLAAGRRPGDERHHGRRRHHLEPRAGRRRRSARMTDACHRQVQPERSGRQRARAAGMRARLATLPADPLVDEKRRDLDRIIAGVPRPDSRDDGPAGRSRAGRDTAAAPYRRRAVGRAGALGGGALSDDPGTAVPMKRSICEPGEAGGARRRPRRCQRTRR